jgi:hypothetical protein
MPPQWTWRCGETGGKSMAAHSGPLLSVSRASCERLHHSMRGHVPMCGPGMRRAHTGHGRMLYVAACKGGGAERRIPLPRLRLLGRSAPRRLEVFSARGAAVRQGVCRHGDDGNRRFGRVAMPAALAGVAFVWGHLLRGGSAPRVHAADPPGALLRHYVGQQRNGETGPAASSDNVLRRPTGRCGGSTFHGKGRLCDDTGIGGKISFSSHSSSGACGSPAALRPSRRPLSRLRSLPVPSASPSWGRPSLWRCRQPR